MQAQNRNELYVGGMNPPNQIERGMSPPFESGNQS